MPRPGPRPYECVRRAWHSDRHQPIRGSIIQQIFRVVNGNHSAVTKKNREWQEKLPIVVFKAEEIMYSKANSEVEYTDLETLWDRANEAINIIIRRDESAESGDLLPPCVEAALNLGCVAVRASRSQRNNNPRSYLSPRTPVPPSLLDSTIPNEQNQTSADERPATMNLSHSLPESNRPVMQIHRSDPAASCHFSSSYQKFPLAGGNNQFMAAESNNTSMTTGCVYPLYFQPEFSRSETLTNSNAIIVGTPVFPLVVEPAEMGSRKKLFSSKGVDDTLQGATHSDARDKFEKAFQRPECDLSLRLGPFSETCSSRGKGLACDTDVIGQKNPREGGQLNELVSAQQKEFSFFPVEATNDPFGLCTSSRNLEGEVQNSETAVRKRKCPSIGSLGDGQFFWQQEPDSSQLSGRMRWPGL